MSKEVPRETSEQQILASYYSAMSKVKLLSLEEERDLAERTKQGDIRARKKLAEANLRLVVSMALQYRRGRQSLLDLIQEGNVGLMEAVDRYDLSHDTKFSTYAAFWIRACILRSLARSGFIKVGLKDYWAVLRLNKATRALTQELLADPTREQIAQRMELSVDDVEKLQRKAQTTTMVSLEQSVSGADDTQGRRTIADTIACEQDSPDIAIDGEKLHTQIMEALRRLTKREQRVLSLRFGLDGKEPMTLEQVGKLPEFDVSRERIRQIESQALKKMDGPLAEALFEHLA